MDNKSQKIKDITSDENTYSEYLREEIKKANEEIIKNLIKKGLIINDY